MEPNLASIQGRFNRPGIEAKPKLALHGHWYGSMPVLAEFWPGNRRAKNRAGTIGGTQF